MLLSFLWSKILLLFLFLFLFLDRSTLRYLDVASDTVLCPVAYREAAYH
jgi:hypothetical protein